METISDPNIRAISMEGISLQLTANTTYQLQVRVKVSSDSYRIWSDTVTFYTIAPEVEINNKSVDLKIDWNNPFYGGSYTKIRYSIPEGPDKKVFLGIYTLSGRLVRVLVNNKIELSEVIHTKKWDGRDDAGSMVGSGTYIVHLRVGEKYKTENVCFVR